MFATPLNTSISQVPSVLDAVAAAAHAGNGEALRELSDRLGYDTLDDKGRLALFRALRRKVKLTGPDGQDPANAFVALERAFAVPYKALQEHAQRKALAKAFSASMTLAPTPTLESSVVAEAAVLDPPVQKLPSVALPESWVRIRAMDGTLDVPRDTFRGAGYFDTLINGPMQGGRDEEGAYMVSTDVETLRAIVYFLSHAQLPRLSESQVSAVRIQADALCLTELAACIDEQVEDTAFTTRLAAAEALALSNLRGRFAAAQHQDTLSMAVRAFRLLMTTLRSDAPAASTSNATITLSLNDAMLGRLNRDVEFVLRGAFRTTYSYAFREGKDADAALHGAALACEEALNEVGICITECSASAATNEVTFRLRS